MKTSITTCALLSSLFFACGAPATFDESITAVRTGMTPAQVQDILGAPDNRQFSGTREGWTYRFYQVSPQLDQAWYDHYVVLFDNGFVYSLYNYAHHGGVQPIDFRDDPARRGENTVNIKVGSD